MAWFFKKEIVSNPIYLSNGRAAGFVRVPGGAGIYSTDDEKIATELRIAVRKHRGGVSEITQDEFLQLRYPYSDAKRPTASKPPPLPETPKAGEPAGIDQLYVKWKIAKGRFTPNGAKAKPEPRLIHVIERHKQKDADAERRVRNAFNSWFDLYCTGKVVPCHVWDYPRNARHTIGDSRDLPYMKDVLMAGMNTARDSDYIMLTNDDTLLHKSAADAVLDAMQTRDAISSFRLNFAKGKVPSMSEEIGKIQLYGQPDLGRDLFCFKVQWLRDNWNTIPDFILGELEWDLVMAVMVRRAAGEATTKANLSEPTLACELPRGYVLHEMHERLWTSERLQQAPAKRWNNRLMAEWHADNGFENLISKII